MQKTVAVDQLRPGMYLLKLCGPWMQHPFWRTSFLIEDHETIAQIRSSGIREVVIDPERGLDVAVTVVQGGYQPAATQETEPPAAEAVEAPPTLEAPAEGTEGAPVVESGQKHAFVDEIIRARRICFESKAVVESMLREARLGKAIDAGAAMPVVEAIANSVLRNADALISVARLKTADDYTYLHSVAVCALMIALARELGLGEDEAREAGFAGLLHDFGKAVMPPEILNKPGRLTDEEYAIVKRHPVDGFRMLREGGIANKAALDVALLHHERMDGQGYPLGKAGEEIPLLARMGAVCDVYDAITSNRAYKAGWDPAESIRRMTSWKGHFDTRVLKAFIRSIGIYPLGALVRLESGKLGVVVEQHPTELIKPTVKVFYSAVKRTQVLIHWVDLSEPDCQDRIVGVESPAAWGFKNLENLWLP